MIPSLDLMALLAVETLRISLPTIVEAARGRVSSDVCDERLNWWSRRLIEEAGIRLEVRGREHVAPGSGYIVMSNHQSSYDIPVLYQALQIPLRMVAKKEIFRIPLVGSAMRAAGFVEVDRQNRRSAMESLVTAHQRLRESMSIWIAPEGTRSRTGHLNPFKRGGFRLAIASGMPILPVTIDGTRQSLPAGRLTVLRGKTARVTVSSPIDPASYGPEGIDNLIAAVREAIGRYLPAVPDLETSETRSRETKNERGNQNH